jgi:HrpA-like RNA helicase
MQPQELPVYRQKDRILEALAEHQVIVVESPTGSGKTTQLPIILHEAGYSKGGMIGVTQPRRIAAVSVSEYIAKQLDVDAGELGTGEIDAGELGTEAAREREPAPSTPDGSVKAATDIVDRSELVGYKMRFEDHTSPSTQLKIMTDGILLQEIKADYMLSQYSVIMIDEAHERSLNIDFILGLLKRILEERPQFKVIVSSATINAEVFSQYFDSCPVVRIDSQMYPVQVVYDPPLVEDAGEELVRKITEIVGRVMHEEREGDILIFLSGEKLIKDTIAELRMQPYSRNLYILPLYGRLSKEEQDRVFPPPPEGKTKVVVSTNIAETSITIDGITSVIDSGLAKMNYYNPRSYTSSLVEGPISKASANQRKGRAGRTRPGTCYRLYTREDFEARELFTLEEIYRTDLSEVVLRMAELGIRDFESFDFISSPGRQNIIAAVETLILLDALNEDNSLSEIGRRMAEFPLLPRHSRMIVESIRNYPDVIRETVIAAAFLTTNTPFLLPEGEELAARKAHHRYRDDMGDFVSYLKLLRAYGDADDKQKFCERRYLDPRTMAEIWNVQEQLGEIVGDMGVPVVGGGSTADYLTAVSRGLIQFVCVYAGRGNYRSLTAGRIMIHPGSVLFREEPEFIVAGEIVRTSRTYARSVSPLERSWLPRILGDLTDDFLDLTRSGKGKGKSKKEAKEDKQRDTTWQIRIAGQTFQLETHKGKKKIAVLPWRQLHKLLQRSDIDLLPQHANLKGKIVLDNGELLTGTKLGEIFRIAPHIDPRRDYVTSWPKKRSYEIPADMDGLCGDLHFCLKMVKGKKSTKTLSFLSLQTDGRGSYWFKPQKNYYTAAYETLASLDAVSDETDQTGTELDTQCGEHIGNLYRRLTTVIETY